MLTPNEEACYKVFVERAMNWYGFAIHHVTIKKAQRQHHVCRDQGWWI